MRVTSEFDPVVADTLAAQLEKVLCSYAELGRGEILMACMIVICSTVKSIDCRDCRRLAVKTVKKELPEMMRDASAQASAQPDGLNHHH